MAEWAWVESAHRYRNKETGRFLSASAERELRDDFVARTAGEVSTLAGRVASEEIGPDAWERGVRSHVRLVNTAQYLFGRGGRNAMTEDDTAALAEIVRDQWTYLGRFADDVARGTMSEAQIRARSILYVNAARGAYARGRTATYAGLVLPVQPGEDSICLVNCQCSWVIKETADTWECTWTLTSGENCETCRERADQWAPLRIDKEGGSSG
jgi:hypothetical protein